MYLKQANLIFFTLIISPDYFIHFMMASRDFSMPNTSSFRLLPVLDIKMSSAKTNRGDTKMAQRTSWV
jgi:hypothetical protein